MGKQTLRFDPKTTWDHNIDRLLNMTASAQRVGILVVAGALKPQQQTFVASAVRDPNQTKVPGAQLAHLSAGGIYAVHTPRDPRYNFLLREGFEPDKYGYFSLPLSYAAWSVEGRKLIATDLTATNPVHQAANRVDLAEEGTHGLQGREGGSKTRLEAALSAIKTNVHSSMSIQLITVTAVEQLKLVSRDMVKRMMERRKQSWPRPGPRITTQ